MAVDEAKCAYHPGRAARVACERCGAFACSLCVRKPNDGLCIDCHLRRLRVKQTSVWSRLYDPQSRMATTILLLLLLLPVGLAFIAWLAVRL